MKPKIRVVVRHINDFPTDEFKALHKPGPTNFLSEPGGIFDGGAGYKTLLSGEYDLFIDYMLNNFYTETAYVKIVHRDTLKAWHFVGSYYISTWELEKYLNVFHSTHYRDGTIIHTQRGRQRGWKVINEYPSENKVRIAQDDGSGKKMREEFIARDYSPPVTENDWLAILHKSESKGHAEVSEAVAVLNRSYKFDEYDCEKSRFLSDYAKDLVQQVYNRHKPR